MRSSKLPTVFSLWLLLGASAFGQSFLRSPAFIASLKPAAAGGGGGGPTYTLQENFDGAGYQNSWIESAAGFDEDYTGTVLEGTQSLRCNPPSFTYVKTAMNKGEVWGRVRFRYAASAANPMFALSRDGVQNEFELVITTGNRLFVRSGTSVGITGSTALSTGTEYWVWFHWAKGTGANGVATAWLSTNSTKPGSPECDTSSGNSANNCDIADFQGNSGDDIIWDQLWLSDSTFE